MLMPATAVGVVASTAYVVTAVTAARGRVLSPTLSMGGKVVEHKEEEAKAGVCILELLVDDKRLGVGE